MLSIGKLGAGQAKYYLDEAEGRVDVVDTVGEGLEEYYLGPTEERGEWVGAAAAELGLVGAVDGSELRRVLGGLDPHDGSSLRGSTSPVRVAGFDLTFSAPKSVSVLFGVGDAETRGRVRVAHDLAALDALGYLERSAAAVRRGHAGAIVEQSSGLVAAAFRHRTSRVGDPQLHTHVLVANLGKGTDGRWSSLDGRQLYAHARTASFIYQAVLRGELTRTLGVEWTPVSKGIAEVVGVPRPVLRAFSRRRAEIEVVLAERGTAGAHAAEAAALATRRPKDARVRAEDLVGEWRVRAEAHGLTRELLARILGRTRTQELDERAWERLWDRLGGPAGLTRRRATFSRGDVLQEACEALPAGVRINARTLEPAADRFLSTSRAVPLMPDAESRETGDAFRRRDGRVLPTSVGSIRYSTPSQLALERRLIECVLRLRGASIGAVREQDVERALAAHPLLSSEQRLVVERLCVDGDGIAAVAGKAGTGKTTALSAARVAWQAAGYPVLGVATARRAAKELEEGAGIPSTSTAALLSGLRGGGETLPARCVLVVDEAGMASTRQLSELADHIERAKGKLVLAGDHRQLPELEAGGVFRAIVQRGLALELTENLRQQHTWERDALDHLRDGRPESALELYDTHGRLVIERTAETTRDRLVRDWCEARDLDATVMIAQRRADVADLNARARETLREAGSLIGPELRLHGGEFCAGDRVVLKRNYLSLGVSNGDRGEVVRVDVAAGSVAVRCGDRTIMLNRDYLTHTTADGQPTLLHGYAITGHVAQGVTVRRSFVLASAGMSREWAYVALSRGRESNHLYVAEQPENARSEYAPTDHHLRDARQRLVAGLRESAGQVLAIDTGRAHATATESDVATERRIEAERSLAERARERKHLEGKRGSWLPGVRRQLHEARTHEQQARIALRNARRAEAEARHGSRPFITEDEIEARTDRVRERIADRATERVLRHGHDLGREM